MSALAIAARTRSQQRLLPGDGDTASFEDHLERYGALPRVRNRESALIAAVRERFVAGEETALVSWLNGGDAKPTFAPPRPFERGVGGKPTLVQNVETLANIALIARYGPAWFRELGSDIEPGSVLVTVGGAVRHPGVIEVERGMPVRAVLERCGGPTAEIQALL